MHEHHGHGHDHAISANADRGKLRLALGLILGFMLVEVVAGLLAGSLALLSDAAHMLTDAGAIGLALAAAAVAARPPSGRFTFGLGRAEILSAQANGATLLVLAGVIGFDAVHRLFDPPDVEGGIVLAVGLLGAAVNIGAAWALARAQRQSLNVKGARAHVLTDLYASLGAALAGALVLLFDLNIADPIAALLVALLMLRTAWSLLRDSGRVLLEGAPAGMDPEAIGRALAGHPGVVEVHDLHVWEVTTDFPALAAHVLVAPGDDCHRIRRELQAELGDRFGIRHTTLQVDHEHAEASCARTHRAARLAREEQQRRRDRAAARLRRLPIPERLVAQPPAADERRRAAAVQIDRGVAAEAHEHARELLERQARLALRAAVARDRDQAAGREAQRRPRVAAVGDVGVELRLAGREALGIERAVEAGLAVAHQQRAGLQEVAARLGRQLVALGDPHLAAGDAHAGAHVAPRPRERHAPALDAVGPQFTQRHAARAHEEPADQRLLHAASSAPRRQLLRLAEDRHPQLGAALGMGRRVHGGGRAAGERDTGAREAPAGLLAWECDAHVVSVLAQADSHVKML